MNYVVLAMGDSKLKDGKDRLLTREIHGWGHVVGRLHNCTWTRLPKKTKTFPVRHDASHTLGK